MTTNKKSLFEWKLNKIRAKRSKVLDTIHNLETVSNLSPNNIHINEVVKDLNEEAYRLQKIMEHMKQNQSTMENLNKKAMEVYNYLQSKNQCAWIEVAKIDDDGHEELNYHEEYNLLQMNVAVGIWETYTKTHPQSEIKFHIDTDASNPHDYDDWSFYTDIIDIGTTILTTAEMIEVYGGVQ